MELQEDDDPVLACSILDILNMTGARTMIANKNSTK